METIVGTRNRILAVDLSDQTTQIRRINDDDRRQDIGDKGLGLSQAEFLQAGERIHILERLMNMREGISRKDETLPARFLREGRVCDPMKLTVPLEAMLDGHYRLRGFDPRGIPKVPTLSRLGLNA